MPLASKARGAETPGVNGMVRDSRPARRAYQTGRRQPAGPGSGLPGESKEVSPMQGSLADPPADGAPAARTAREARQGGPPGDPRTGNGRLGFRRTGPLYAIAAGRIPPRLLPHRLPRHADRRLGPGSQDRSLPGNGHHAPGPGSTVRLGVVGPGRSRPRAAACSPRRSGRLSHSTAFLFLPPA